MNAVNLIPLDSRRAQASGLPGLPFLGLLAALVVALGATVAYVDARNNVSARRSELAQVQSATAGWTSAAARYASDVAALKQRATRFVELGTLLGQRGDWSLLLGQIAGVMPAHAELSSLSAASSGAAAAAASATGGASTATGGASTGTGTGITVAGCAVSQSVVADTMIALRKVSGVSAVSLSSSSRGTSASSGAASSSSCSLPVQFSLTLQFSPAVAAVQTLEAEAVAKTGAGSDSTTAQPAASADSTGAAQ